VERGLDKSGIRLFGAGDITDDDLLNNMGDLALGIETAYFYSAAHPSEKNKAFVEGMKQANNGMRANFFGVSGYDGMHLIYEAIRKTGGKTDGNSFIGAVKGMSWESPRGPMTIDPETRDVISNVYMRRVERVNGELWNIEFATVENVKDRSKRRRNSCLWSRDGGCGATAQAAGRGLPPIRRVPATPAARGPQQGEGRGDGQTSADMMTYKSQTKCVPGRMRSPVSCSSCLHTISRLPIPR
jgi:hypothetical protein